MRDIKEIQWPNGMVETFKIFNFLFDIYKVISFVFHVHISFKNWILSIIYNILNLAIIRYLLLFWQRELQLWGLPYQFLHNVLRHPYIFHHCHVHRHAHQPLEVLFIQNVKVSYYDEIFDGIKSWMCKNVVVSQMCKHRNESDWLDWSVKVLCLKVESSPELYTETWYF